MKPEQQNSGSLPPGYPTAGFGSVAPHWIKADLMPHQPSNKTPVPTETPQTWEWLRRQLGWHS